ncbi:hypothetical protein DENIS_0856 [Desulfonema ishimotonii]|uniref:YtkA-like domain-containing protein n=1 Tax=Desulfonema ishimotonii TaxID=45657 RepID=A0A401FSG3_9BACT|nr:hypothetical protein [Desulfonema ishimotonii]GBC59914.1 hypothetical protein DENIS_0856 [Desulfonema ishimotonii]
MRKFITASIMTLALTLAAGYPVIAGNEGHDHSAHEKMDSSMENAGHGSTDHSGHTGNKIHEARVNGWHLTYELIDMREKMKGMKNMPEMKNTHHLMVYVRDAEGKTVDNAKVGYLIEGPDDARQKAMCMGMGGGFGADVNMGAAGKYMVKTKVMAGDTKLMDEFGYEVR